MKANHNFRKALLFFLAAALWTTGIAQAGTAPDGYDPYKEKPGLFHKIVYLDFDGVYMPVRPDDYLLWGMILGGVVTIILVMLAIVRVKEVIGVVRERENRSAVGAGFVREEILISGEEV